MKTSKLRELIQLRPGISYSASDYSSREEGGNVFINLKCIQRGGGFSRRGIKYYKGDYKEKHVVRPGDLIIAVTDLTKDAQLVGSPLFLPEISTNKPIIMSMDLASIHLDEKILTKEYLASYLMTPAARRYMKENSRGTTVLHLDKEAFLNFEIHYPESLEEQNRIAKFLTCVDKNINLTEQTIKKLEQIKIGMMNSLLTKGIGHSEFKDSELGMIPMTWEIKTLQELGDCVGGLTYSPTNVVESGGKIVLRSPNISEEGQLLLNNIVRVNMPIKEKTLVKENDILICSRNGSQRLIGKALLIPNKMAGQTFGAFMCVLRSEHGPYLINLFNSPIIKEQIKRGLGSTINQITNADLNSYIVPFPSDKEEIKKITDNFSILQAKINIANQKLKKLSDIKKGLLNELL